MVLRGARLAGGAKRRARETVTGAEERVREVGTGAEGRLGTTGQYLFLVSPSRNWLRACMESKLGDISNWAQSLRLMSLLNASASSSSDNTSNVFLRYFINSSCCCLMWAWVVLAALR